MHVDRRPGLTACNPSDFMFCTVFIILSMLLSISFYTGVASYCSHLPGIFKATPLSLGLPLGHLWTKPHASNP